jgi:hypothetical protein
LQGLAVRGNGAGSVKKMKYIWWGWPIQVVRLRKGNCPILCRKVFLSNFPVAEEVQAMILIGVNAVNSLRLNFKVESPTIKTNWIKPAILKVIHNIMIRR